MLRTMDDVAAILDPTVETKEDRSDLPTFKREEAVKYLGGVVRLPGDRDTVTIDDCEPVGEDGATYTDDNGCPECGSDLIITVIRDPNYAYPRINAEWMPGAEVCSNYTTDSDTDSDGTDGCSYNG